MFVPLAAVTWKTDNWPRAKYMLCEGGRSIFRSGMMKFLLTVVVTTVLLAGFATGQKAPPDPQGPSALPITEVATPSGTPEPQVAPDLLPESNQLPAEPPDLRLPSPSILK